MKIQADDKHNLHWRRFFLADFSMTFNGEKIAGVVEADDEEGYIIVFARDEAGKLIVDGDRPRTERREGVVVFAGTRRVSDFDRKAMAQTRRDRRQLRNLRNAGQGGVG